MEFCNAETQADAAAALKVLIEASKPPGSSGAGASNNKRGVIGIIAPNH
jgi:hypothetical protein